MVRFGNDLVCCSFYFVIHITKFYITTEFFHPETFKDKTVTIIEKNLDQMWYVVQSILFKIHITTGFINIPHIFQDPET